MNFTFTHEELFNPRYNFSTLIVLSVIKTLASEKEIVTNRELFKNLPISEKTVFRCIKTLKKELSLKSSKKAKNFLKMKSINKTGDYYNYSILEKMIYA